MKKLLEYGLETVLLAFLQVTVFAFLFALPIKLLWFSVISTFSLSSFLPLNVTYFSIVGAIFILLTLFKIFKSIFK